MATPTYCSGSLHNLQTATGYESRGSKVTVGQSVLPFFLLFSHKLVLVGLRS